MEVDKKTRWQNLSVRVDKGEGAALAAKVDERRGRLQVLRQSERGGAGGEQGDCKEVHLSDCLGLALLVGFGMDVVEWFEQGCEFDFIQREVAWQGLPKRGGSSCLVNQVFPRSSQPATVLGSFSRLCRLQLLRFTDRSMFYMYRQ